MKKIKTLGAPASCRLLLLLKVRQLTVRLDKITDVMPSKQAISEPPRPWRSRGYLPHFDQPGLVQSLTFRLADSLPRTFIEQCERDLRALPESTRQTEKERQIAAYLDQGAGACQLRDQRIAKLVEDALLYFDVERYRILGWCVMPNHVHAVIGTKPGYPLKAIVHSWKSFPASRANRILQREGRFWQR
ncbi:MAG: transposase [Acidobacteriota bacterium]